MAIIHLMLKNTRKKKKYPSTITSHTQFQHPTRQLLTRRQQEEEKFTCKQYRVLKTLTRTNSFVMDTFLLHVSFRFLAHNV